MVFYYTAGVLKHQRYCFQTPAICTRLQNQLGAGSITQTEL